MDDTRFGLKHLVSIFLKLAIAVMSVVSLLRGDYVWFIGGAFALFLTLVPTILERDFKMELPLIFDTTITISIFFHAIGSYHGFYYNVPFYDHFTHFVSAATVSLIGVTLLYDLAFHVRIVKLPPLGFGIFTVLFVMSMGLVWEFLEWGFDLMLGTTLQRGLHDTMLDLLFDTIAGVIVGTISTLKLSRGEPLVERPLRGE
ncbi:MAG TPA: hypothetical protein ENN68_01315 [Methanomicrobia archaeon]|nr:hypothetical protein [Methanomicrobia archaeon]